MPNVYTQTRLFGGSFQDSSGAPLTLGKLEFRLNHDSNISTLGGPNGIQVVAGVPIYIYLSVNGSIFPSSYIWSNAILTPANSYYTVRAFNSSGLEIWMSPQIFQIPYLASLDFGTLQPLIP